MADDFGKVRVYTCPCGGEVVRPLHGDPKPCDQCGQDLTAFEYRIDDHKRFLSEWLTKHR